MINRIYRLMDTKRIDMVQREILPGSDILLASPQFVSVCAADQRYYQGKRRREVMREKLPMALIHEATATVMYDPSGMFPQGTVVVPIPLRSHKKTIVKPNYDEKSEFCSSGKDGFLCDFIEMPRDGFVTVSDDSIIYVFSELVSVVLNAFEAFEQSCITGCDSFGVWGDGSVGYVVCLLLRCFYPDAQIYIFGKTARKLNRFSFADTSYFVDDVPDGLRVDHAFECAGGTGSESALRQIIEIINPQGCVNLLGVSEEEICINTRKVLDKGLKLIGNSRSSADDFFKAVQLIRENVMCQKYLKTLISEVIDIHMESDIIRLFENDILNDFKTIGRWLL